jgi:hypothetical protein
VRWVELCTAGTLAEGELLRERLEQRGIRVLLKKNVMAFGLGRQGTLLFVPQERRSEADAVWRETLGEDNAVSNGENELPEVDGAESRT